MKIDTEDIFYISIDVEDSMYCVGKENAKKQYEYFESMDFPVHVYHIGITSDGIFHMTDPVPIEDFK